MNKLHWKPSYSILLHTSLEIQAKLLNFTVRVRIAIAFTFTFICIISIISINLNYSKNPSDSPSLSSSLIVSSLSASITWTLFRDCHSLSHMDGWSEGFMLKHMRSIRTTADTITPLISCSSCEAAGRSSSPALTLPIRTSRQRSYLFSCAAVNALTSLIFRIQK